MRYTRPDTVRGNLHLSSRGVLAELAGNGIIVPSELSDLDDHIERLTQRRKELETDHDHRDASLGLLAEDPYADIDGTVDDELRAATIANTLLHAADDASRRLRQVITQHADELVDAIRDTLFEPALVTLTAAAKAGAATTTETLLRSGDVDAARAVADAPIARATVRTAYRLRAKLYPGSDLDRMVCSVWRKPNPQAFHDVDDDDRILVGIRAGHELWFGTYTEVDRASQDHAHTLEAEERARRAKIAQSYGRLTRRKKPTPSPETTPADDEAPPLDAA